MDVEIYLSNSASPRRGIQLKSDRAGTLPNIASYRTWLKVALFAIPHHQVAAHRYITETRSYVQEIAPDIEETRRYTPEMGPYCRKTSSYIAEIGRYCSEMTSYTPEIGCYTPETPHDASETRPHICEIARYTAEITLRAH